MAVVEYTPERRDVTARGQVLASVQGLTLDHVSVLIREHLPDLEGIVELFRKEGGVDALNAEEWLKLAMPIVTQAPGFAANIIAVAADEPTAATKIQKWPFSVQLAAIMVIFELTFTEIGEVKKALGIVATLLTAKKRTVGHTGIQEKKRK